MNTTNPDKSRPLYQIVIDDVLARIENGDFSFDQPICTENMLIEQYGFSRITVRRAMSDLEARGILYRKRGVGSFVSRNMEPRQSQNVNPLRLFEFILPFNLSLSSGLSVAYQTASRALQQNGYWASLRITGDELNARGRTFLAGLADLDIAGIAYYPKTSDIHLELLHRLLFYGKPVVLIDLPSPNRYIASVSSDNFSGGMQLMEHLLALGHRRIGYVSGLVPTARKSLSDRFDAYVLSMTRAGLPIDNGWIITTLTLAFRRSAGGVSSPTQLHAAARALVEQGVTAVLCEHDQLAYELTIACREMGVRVPEQFSICGFDHSEWARMVPEGITTVQQDMEAIGKRTAELLLRGVDEGAGGPLSVAEQVVIPTSLVVGGTTCAAPTAPIARA